MKGTTSIPALVFSFLFIAVFGFGQTNKQAQTTFELDLPKLTQSLKAAPDFSEKSLHTSGPVIELPMPGGVRKSFRLFRTHPMHPGLAAKFPEIQTYHGKCYDDGVSGISVTISPTGLHAMVVDDQFERIYIKPEGGADKSRYVSFYEPEGVLSNYICPMGHEAPEVVLPKKQAEENFAPEAPAKSMVNNANALGDKLRTHRLAVSCTGEYATQQGGTVALVMAKIVENVNAMNLIYIREAAINFQLVPNNDLVIYLNGATDPYVNDGHHTPDLDNVHNTLTNIIGSANFDVGHLMQDPSATCPGCGGWAGVGVPCDNNGKGKGMSVQSIPVLIHEMGHQFNCAHTTDNLATRRDHIKIGNTIMGNGGIPGPSNYFHIVSADSVGRYVEQAGYCVPGTNTGNTIPMVDVGTGGMHIPKGTPFQLSGSATDPDPNTTLLYNWQQYNIGDTYDVINNRIHPVGNVPVFRNYFPTADGNVRTIPRLPDLVNNIVAANVEGDTMDYEGLPTYSRNLTFRLVARDFEPTGGAFDYAELSFQVDGNSGPFVVTSPNTGNPTWTAGNSVTVTWNVANTNNAPVNCATVNIKLSLDGGYNYPITLAAATANDGSHTFTLPPGTPQSTFARVRVESATHDNVRFFDISNGNFTINSDCKAASALISPAENVTAPAGSPSLNLNPAPVFGLSNSTTTFNVAATGTQTQFALWNTAQSACQVGCCANYYSTRQFQVDRAGTYTFGYSFNGGGAPGFMSIHAGAYNPNSVCDGFLTSNWRATAGVDLVDPIEAALVPGTTYTMVFHPWFGNSTASGTASVNSTTGGNVAYLNQGPPPPSPPGDYGYTYAAVNTANGQITAISAGADFTGLAAGTYHIYGLSYKSANPPPAVVNPNDFLNMTIAQAIGTNQCIYFSSNFIKVVVEPGACTPPSLNPPFVTQPTCSTPGTIVVDATGNGTLEYSVDNGATWSTNAIFSGLAPGNYNVKARLQADQTCMASWVFNPVVLNTPSGCCPAGNVIFVNDDASGSNDGTSWANAHTDLQAALAATANCPGVTQVWVAAGTYKPTAGTDRTIAFVLKNNLAIYGGFNGTETQLSERDWLAANTLLSGDIGVPNDNSDNSYHVVRNVNINSTAILDGFVVAFGNANGTGEYLWGGGAYNFNNASPTFMRCFFIENNALEGGGMFNHTNSSPTISACIISSNYAAQYNGGGIANSESSSPVIVNTLFRENAAVQQGGAMFSTGNCSPILMNCTLVDNAAASAGGIWNQFGSNPTVTNSIFWNNTGGSSTGSTTFRYTLLEDAACPAGSTCNAGMIYNTDPLFVSPTDHHLQACSPAKDAGTATGAPATDFDGDARPQEAGFDLGYDESTTACSTCLSYAAADTPINILDLNTVTSIITVPLTGTLTDVNILNLTGTHTYNGDLIFRLASPQGTTVVLIQNQCGSQQNFNISLNDQAANPLSCPLNAGNTHQPQNPLSAFNGQNPLGNWVLSVEDNAGGDFGVLTGWTLEICGTLGGNCPTTLSVPGTISSGTYQASASLTSTGTVPSGSTVSFKAGSDITLQPLFGVSLGAVFEAVMETCVPFAPPKEEER